MKELVIYDPDINFNHSLLEWAQVTSSKHKHVEAVRKFSIHVGPGDKHHKNSAHYYSYV